MRTLVRVPIHSVINIFGAEVRPDSEYGAARLVAEMSARRAGRAPITMGVAASAAAVNSITSQRADMRHCRSAALRAGGESLPKPVKCNKEKAAIWVVRDRLRDEGSGVVMQEKGHR